MADAEIALDLFPDKPAGAVKRAHSRQRLTIEEMREIARQYGGECLSAVYTNANTKLRWRCGHGHEWEALPKKTKHRGKWCPQCSLAKRGRLALCNTIEDMHQIARARGGECLSETYINSSTRLHWRCREGHEWEAPPNTIKNAGTWCRICSTKKRAIKRRRHTIEEMREIARVRGGECLSDSYTSYNHSLRWRCYEGHEWEALPSNIVSQGTWCPMCQVYYKEAGCRSIVEHLFGSPFPKVRPRWLKSEHGGRMELDGYNKHLGIAFEYNGEQHYYKVSRYYKTTKELKERRDMDLWKRWLCEKHRVVLLVIPYWVKYIELPEWIARNLKELGVSPPNNPPINVNVRTVAARSRLAQMKELAIARGGECLSEAYIESNMHLRWRCAQGHEWLATGGSVKNGTWCAVCSSLERGLYLRDTIEMMQKIAHRNGGECLSESYIDSDTKLHWRCAEGHEWWAVGREIKNRGAWCRICGHKNRGRTPQGTIEKMQELARSRGGECLSTSYGKSRTNLRWRCDKGHEWEATPAKMKNTDLWCPKCWRRGVIGRYRAANFGAASNGGGESGHSLERRASDERQLGLEFG